MDKRRKQKAFIFLAIVLGGFLLYLAWLEFGPKAAASRAQVIFLDVGQGDAILIQEKDTQILIDGGDGQSILNRLGGVMPLFDKRIELVILTHPDEDHMGGLIKVLESYEVEAVLESRVACDKLLCRRWEDLMSARRIPVISARLGTEVAYGEDIELQVLYPVSALDGIELEDSNASSLVLRARVGGNVYLLTGDMETKTEQELMVGGVDLGADVLKVAHHGSKNSTSAAFLREVLPREAVISVGKNSYGHPTEELLARLRNMNIRILRTDELGNIRF